MPFSKRIVRLTICAQVLLLCHDCNPFVSLLQRSNHVTAAAFSTATCSRQNESSSPSLILLHEKKTEYSRELYLREESESPFRKVRFFFYFSLGGGALTSLAISAARVAAALNGINQDLLQESAINVVVDLVGLAALTALYKNDLAAQESRLKRASKGAQMAKLTIRASKSIVTGNNLSGARSSSSSGETFTTTLASLRRGRGIEKRVVIAAAGLDKITQVLQQAKELRDELTLSDLLIIPYVLGSSDSTLSSLSLLQSNTRNDDDDELPDCVALSTGGSNWKSFIEEEVQEATKQGVNVQDEGLCVILKKNGRIGQRTKGIYLDNMVADVTGRASMGMDITNI